MNAAVVVIPVVLAAVAFAFIVWRDVCKDEEPSLPPARPGSWFMSYHSAWTQAHPGAFQRGDLKSGSFCLGTGHRDGADVWCSSTLEWDREWFRANGMGLPRHTQRVDGPGPCKPNEFRIGTLGAGESVSFPIEFEQ